MYQLSNRNLIRSFSKSHLTNKRTFVIQSNQTSFQPKDYDIIIVGGGPVGLALANALASCKSIQSSRIQISVLDSTNLDQLRNWSLPNGDWSNRVSSVTNQNISFLKKIGVWQHIDLSRTNLLERMEVWDGLSNARIIFDSADGYEPNEIINSKKIPHMARFIENVHLQSSMIKNLQNQKNVDLIGSTKVENIQSDSNNLPMIYLNDGKILRTRLLIGADGFNSPVKSYAKITSTGWNYDAHCVVGTLELEPTDLNHTAWQRFLTSGPLGILPLSDRCGSLAWSTKPKIAAGLKSLTPQTLSSVINACFTLPHTSIEPILTKISSHSKENPIDSNLIQTEIDWIESLIESNPISSDEKPPKVIGVRMKTIASFPLRMFHADQYIGNTQNQFNYSGPSRVALVGDAAHVLHPMAGQGLNLGLGDARELAKTIKLAIENGQDIGSLTALSPYARSRYFNNHLVMATVDKLNKLYSIKSSPIVWARSVGVEVFNELPTLKNLMMGKAGGDDDLKTNQSGLGGWGKVADLFETVEKVKYLSNGMIRMGLGAIGSVLKNATSRT